MIILVKPLISEKSMQQAKSGLYTFIVASEANKLQVAKAVAEKYSVKVLSVKIINSKPKIKSQRKARSTYSTSKIKKALVQLAKDQKLAIFEAQSVEEETTTPDANIKETKSLLKGTKVKVERNIDVPVQTTQRKVITGK